MKSRDSKIRSETEKVKTSSPKSDVEFINPNILPPTLNINGLTARKVHRIFILIELYGVHDKDPKYTGTERLGAKLGKRAAASEFGQVNFKAKSSDRSKLQRSKFNLEGR